jgi:putative transposase
MKSGLFLARLKSNRLVNPDNTKNIALETIDVPPKGIVVHLIGMIL